MTRGRRNAWAALLLVTGALGGWAGAIVASWVYRLTAAGSPAGESIVFWIVFCGGLYKGIASALRLVRRGAAS